MYFPRFSWHPGDSRTWADRALYLLSPPASFNAPEATAVFVALAVCTLIDVAVVLGISGTIALIASVAILTTAVSGAVLGVPIAVIGVIGLLFFWLAASLSQDSIRTEAIQHEQLLEALQAVDGASQILALGLLLIVVWLTAMWSLLRSRAVNPHVVPNLL